MAKIIQQSWPNKVTYIIDIDEKILKKGTFNYLALASDQARVARCSLFQDLLKRTTPQHNQAHAIHSFKMENTAQGGTRFTMTSQPYAFTQAQVDQMIAVIHQRAHEANLSRFPLVDEDGLSRDELLRRQAGKEFAPNEALKNKNMKMFTAQVALHEALKIIWPGVRSHKGDINVKHISGIEDNAVDVDIEASGSCMGCGSAGPFTIKQLFDYAAQNFDHPDAQEFLKGARLNRINVSEVQNPGQLSYYVDATGVYDAASKPLHQFNLRPNLSSFMST